MLRRLSFLFSLCLLLSACQQQGTVITSISDLPLKTDTPPSFDWKNAPLRANAQYFLYNANSNKERRAMMGDYYILSWYDAEPDKPVRIVMQYTQAKTGPKILERVIEYRDPRESKGTRKAEFVFNGKERAEQGDILSWKVEIFCDGKVTDSRCSYLWE